MPRPTTAKGFEGMMIETDSGPTPVIVDPTHTGPPTIVYEGSCSPIRQRGVGADLVRIVAEKRPDGLWNLTRERAENGERFICDDLHDVLDAVLAAYYPDGTPRPYPRERR